MDGGTKVIHSIQSHSRLACPVTSPMCCSKAAASQSNGREPTCLANSQHYLADAINPQINMEQQILDLSIGHRQPLMHWSEFYDSSPAFHSIWKRRNFLQFIKRSRSFFGDTVVSLWGGVFIRESFLDRLNEWLLVNKQAI